MDKLLSLGYYFSVHPDPDFHFTKLTLLVAGLFLLAALAIRIWRRKYAKDEVLRKMLKRYPGPLVTVSLTLLVLLLFREGGIPIFSMRIWWILLIVIFATWAVRNVLGLNKEYQDRKKQLHHHLAQAKYLPKKKH
jgi:ACR3 family arsenite efflux pump ArsB